MKKKMLTKALTERHYRELKNKEPSVVTKYAFHVPKWNAFAHSRHGDTGERRAGLPLSEANIFIRLWSSCCTIYKKSYQSRQLITGDFRKNFKKPIPKPALIFPDNFPDRAVCLQRAALNTSARLAPPSGTSKHMCPGLPRARSHSYRADLYSGPLSWKSPPPTSPPPPKSPALIQLRLPKSTKMKVA